MSGLPGPLRAARRSFPACTGRVADCSSLDRGSRRLAAVSARLLPSANGRVDRGFRRLFPASTTFLTSFPIVHLHSRPGLPRSVPGLGRPLVVRRVCCRPPPVSTGALDDWLRSLHASCRPPTVASTGAFAVRTRPRRASRASGRPSPVPTGAPTVHPRPREAFHHLPPGSTGLLPSIPILGKPLAIRPGLDRGSCQPSRAQTALLVHPGFDRGFTPAIPGLSPSAHAFYWGFRHSYSVSEGSRHPSLASTGLLPSVPILGRPLAIRPGLDRGFHRPSPAQTALLVRLRFRPGLPPFIPSLGGLLTVHLWPRPGLLYCSSSAFAGLSPPASGFERGLCRPSPTSEGFSPAFPVFNLASSRHSRA